MFYGKILFFERKNLTNVRIRALTPFRPNPFPIKGYDQFHDIVAALLTKGGFVPALFDLRECGFKRGFDGFAGTDYLSWIFTVISNT
jgi:hypothetical protein